MIDHAELWLMRHGKAGSKLATNTEAQDYARTLTPAGERQSVRAGKVLASIGPKFDAMYTSPRLRCIQSAELISPILNIEPQIKDRLDETLEQHPKRALGLVDDGQAVLMVGHGPEWQAVIKKLTGRDVWLNRGGMCAIQIKDGQATVTRLLQPCDVKALA